MADATLTPTANVTITDMPSGTAGTETAPSQTGAAGSGTQLGADLEPKSDAGEPQGSTDDGQSQSGQRRGWSKVDEIRDLRAWRREARQREAGYQSELAGVRQQLEELRQLQQPGRKGTERNPADFWQDPLAAQERLLEERLGGMEERLLDRFQMSREMEAQQQELAQRQVSAVEFIRSQPNYAPEDDEDLIDIIESIPVQRRQTLDPEWVAEWAWLKLNQDRGVGNRSQARARASSVIGQPPGVGLSGKVWSKAEFDATVDALDKQGHRADQKLLDELMSAAKEGRVR
jgi:hypothetical protein